MEQEILKPDIEGPYGQAWRVDIEAIAAYMKRPNHSTVADWVVKAPWANCVWHSYRMTAIHLRPVEGLGDPKIYLPGATHEFWIHAIDPDWEFGLCRPVQVLLPINFGAQFINSSDDEAAATVEWCVRDIVERGIISPDTDYLNHWIARFNDSMIKPNRRGGPASRVEIVKDGKKHVVEFDMVGLNTRPIDRLCPCGQPAAPLNDLCNLCLYKQLG